ncbi:glycosyltransferase family 39 protein [Candidatus Sumerlaeota bacterium]|nr:glycosyltransferase family 39 protein [Candidatus Sumerlaeota bacterium]
MKSTGKVFLIFWMFFWWGFLTYKHPNLFLVYPSLFRSWDLTFAHFPFKETLLSLVPLAVYMFLGHFLLKCFDIFIPRLAYLALSFVLGLSMTTFLGEICGVFGFFYGWAIMGLLLALTVALLVSSSAHWVRPVKVSKGYADDFLMRSAQRSVASRAYSQTIIHPAGFFQGMCAVFFLGGAILITLLIFYHALFYPVTYWDSLSYLGMARSLFLNHRFPVKIVAQMGIGTGSNYPQMYRLASAMPSVVFGFWSNCHAQILAPVCCVGSLLLIYHLILRLTRVTLSALALTLLFCTIPYGIRYFTLTSDYALTILFTAAFLYLAVMYIDTKLRSYAMLSALVAAFACHINYLTPLLLVAWVFLIFLVHSRVPMLSDQEEYSEMLGDPERLKQVAEPEYTYNDDWDTLGELFKSGFFLRLILACFLIAAPWYARNWALTGNPVYPYFSSIFGGKNINPRILSSMQGEWLENGDGIDTAALYMVNDKQKTGTINEENRHLWYAQTQEGGVRFTLFAKIIATFYYLILFQRWAWLLAPIFLALCVPGIIIWIAQALSQKLKGKRHPRSGRLIKYLTNNQKTIFLALFLFVCLLSYHYFLAGYYLYQIIPILAPMILFAFVVMEYFSSEKMRALFHVWCILVIILPGLPFALMNFKITHPVVIKDKEEYPQHLPALRRPGMMPDEFYSHVFGADARMIDHVNTLMLGKTLLTHDNRYLLYDPSINIVHLDDWEMQKAYGIKDEREKLKFFKELKIDYYLRIDMEKKHKILRELNLEQWIASGYLKPIFKAGGNELYSVNYQPQKTTKNQTSEQANKVIIK